MGQLALGLGGAVVGGVVGSFLGNPLLGAQIGWAAGSIIGGILLAPKKPDVDTRPRLGDLSVQSSIYGTTIPRIFGEVFIAGNLLWYPGIKVNGRLYRGGAVVEDNNAGGKGGGFGVGTITTGDGSPRYSADFAVLLCKGPIQKVTRIYADSFLIYDITGNGYTTGPKYADRVTVYLGNETQGPDPTIEAVEGTGQVEPYRGIAYLVFTDLPLTAFGNRLPNIRVELSATATSSFPQATTALVMDNDNTALSLLGTMLYHEEAGVLTKVNRQGMSIVRSRDIETLIENYDIGGSTIFGEEGACTVGSKIILDYARDDVYVNFLQNGTSFWAVFGPDALTVAKTNWQDGRLALTAGEPEGIVVSGGSFRRLIAASRDTKELRCYDVGPNRLNLLWTRDGPTDTVRPGNFVEDKDGVVWVVWYDIGDDTYFWLTKITVGGLVTNTKISANGTYRNIAYSKVNQKFILAGGTAGDVARVNAVTLAFEARQVAASTTATGLRSLMVSQRSIFTPKFSGTFADGGGYVAGTPGQVADAFFWMKGATAMKRMKVSDLSTAETINFSSFTGTPTFTGVCYDRSFDALFSKETTNLQRNLLHRSAVSKPTIGEVIRDICIEAGFEVGDIDVSDAGLTQQLRGYAIPRRMSARNALEPLLAAFLVDPVESDGKLYFKKRGAASVLTITEDHLGVAADSAEGAEYKVIEERIPEDDLPQEVTVTYLSKPRLYDPCTQLAHRSTDVVRSRQKIALEFPVVLEHADAKKLAEAVLFQSWVERVSLTFTLPQRYLRLDGADVVTVVADGVSYGVKVQSVELGANNVLQYRGVVENLDIYTQQDTSEAPDVDPETILPPSPTTLYLLDTPIMQDSDDNAGFYIAVCPAVDDATWPGAVILSSPDDLNYTAILTVLGQSPCIMGTVETKIPSVSVLTALVQNIFDTTTVIRVHLISGTLSSKTQQEVLDGANAALFGDEVIQFQTASLVTTGIYDLSNLLRWRRGTEWAASLHAVGERFVMLSDRKVRRVVPPTGDLNVERSFRGATIHQEYTNAPEQVFKNTGIGLKPFSVYHFSVVKSSNDYIMSWLNRTRVGGEWENGHDVYLGEDSEAYDVDIFSNSGYTTLIQSVRVTSPTYTYLQADWVADIGSGGGTVYFIIYQISARVGRGFPFASSFFIDGIL